MGHADISTTMDIYADATEDKKKEVMTNLEGKIVLYNAFLDNYTISC